MILQRIGINSRMMFCGDTDQIDLKRTHDTGLDFLSKMNVNRLEIIKLLENHRHPILEDIMTAYSESRHNSSF
jgi:phosphate starvation-inducible protein PhoH